MSFGLGTSIEAESSLNTARATPTRVLSASARVEPTKSEDSASVRTSMSVRQMLYMTKHAAGRSMNCRSERGWPLAIDVKGRISFNRGTSYSTPLQRVLTVWRLAAIGRGFRIVQESDLWYFKRKEGSEVE